MARQKKKVCDRCAFGKEKPATSSQRFSVDSTRYELDLCEQHAEKFSRDMYGWSRLAREVEDTSRPFFTREHQDDSRRAAELRAQQRDERQPAPAPEKTESAPETPFSIFGWSMTDHARSRAATRGFDTLEVLTAAAEPEQTYRQPRYGENVAIHQRGDVAVAVNAAERVVISVLHRTAEKYNPDAHRSQIRKAE